MAGFRRSVTERETDNTYMKYNGVDENFSGQKRTRAFPRPRRRRIRELASQNDGNHSSINYIVFPSLSISLLLSEILDLYSVLRVKSVSFLQRLSG